MSEIPWFPAYDVQVCNNDFTSAVTESHMVRITFRVRDEDLEQVIKKLLPNAAIEDRRKLFQR